jgi:hypothetical protein
MGCQPNTPLMQWYINSDFQKRKKPTPYACKPGSKGKHAKDPSETSAKMSLVQTVL